MVLLESNQINLGPFEKFGSFISSWFWFMDCKCRQNIWKCTPAPWWCTEMQEVVASILALEMLTHVFGQISHSLYWAFGWDRVPKGRYETQMDHPSAVAYLDELEQVGAHRIQFDNPVFDVCMGRCSPLHLLVTFLELTRLQLIRGCVLIWTMKPRWIIRERLRTWMNWNFVSEFLRSCL